jgi:uncharacterized protein (DUF2141 family)
VRRNIARRAEAQRDLYMASIARILAGTSAGILMILVTAVAPAASAPVAQATAAAAVLHVRVVNLRNSTGQVICTLFNSPMAFPTDSTSRRAGRGADQR